MTPAQQQRWDEVLRRLATVLTPLTPGPRLVVVDGHRHTAQFADRLAAVLTANGQKTVRLSGTAPLPDEDACRAEYGPRSVVIADEAGTPDRLPMQRWDVVVWLRTPPPAARASSYTEPEAHIVVDLYDPAWPVVRHIAPGLAERHSWYVAETRAFFAARAATWDVRFGDDLPAYAQAVAESGVPPAGVVLDVGCGTGRALPALRAAVGATGTVIGVDFTEQMLATARDHGRDEHAHLLLADALHLPLRDGHADTVFTAGLFGHLPDIEPGLSELARVTADHGRLVLFHPSGRAALAARHGRHLRPDDPLAETPLRRALDSTGWCLERYDDPPHRFFVLATRQARHT